MEDVIQKVAETIRRYALIEKDDQVLAAFSGGTDSVAMLHILDQLQEEMDFSLSAVYINHNLRPRAVKKEIRFCDAFCRIYSIPFFYEEVDIRNLSKNDKTGIEETARIHRYRILERMATEGRFNRIAVGHHRNDRAETILFNLLRGSGRMGLAGIPPKRGEIIRPLYDLSRREIADYLEDCGLKFMTDDSNRSRKFTRNRIRHKIIPVIEKEITEAALDNIVRYSEIMAAEEKFLGSITSRLYDKLVSKTPGGKISLDLGLKLEYDIWLKRRLVFKVLAAIGFDDIEFAEVDRLVELIDGDKDTRLSIRDGYVAELYGGSLYFYRPGVEIGRYEITIPGRYRLNYPRVWINFEYIDEIDVEELKAARGRIACIDANEIEGDLYLEDLQQGGRFHPYGRPGSKKASDFLTDQKYPRPLRDELPVLYDQNGIVWLAGIEIDHRVRIREKTEKIVKIEIGED